MKNSLRIVDATALLRLSADAAAAPRLRKNLNVHPVLSDPFQRLFNAIEPGTYVRPHRHARNDGWELMLAIRGAFSILTFDDRGTVVERVDVGGAAAVAVEIPANTWHAVVVHTPGTVMFEVKPGPYCPVGDKDFAPWAPTEASPACASVVTWYERACAGHSIDSLGFTDLP